MCYGGALILFSNVNLVKMKYSICGVTLPLFIIQSEFVATDKPLLSCYRLLHHQMLDICILKELYFLLVKDLKPARSHTLSEDYLAL